MKVRYRGVLFKLGCLEQQHFVFYFHYNLPSSIVPIRHLNSAKKAKVIDFLELTGNDRKYYAVLSVVTSSLKFQPFPPPNPQGARPLWVRGRKRLTFQAM